MSLVRVSAFLGLGLGVNAQFETLCFPSDQFKYSVVDKISGVTYRWDLSTLCKPSGTYSYKGFGTEGQTFYFNVGGNTSVPCSDYINRNPMYESWGTAVQMLQDGRGINPRDDCLRDDNTTCPDWTYGGDVCCSPRRCEVVALESAVFSPLNRLNLATGGVLLKHSGYPGSDNDFLSCPEQAPGLPRLRTFELNLACNTSGTANDLIVTGYNEGDDGENGQYCRFQVYVSTLAACGVPDVTPPTPESASDVINRMIASGALATPASQFGYVVLGVFLTLFLQYCFEHRVEIQGLISRGTGGGGLPSLYASTKSSSSSSPSLLSGKGGYGATS